MKFQDMRQETYFRLYESASKSRSRPPKAFLFTTARNLVIDRIRRKQADPVNSVSDVDEQSSPVDEADPGATTGGEPGASAPHTGVRRSS